MDDKAITCILQQALGCLWQGSILDSLLPSSPFPSSGDDSSNIMAGMVYKAVDNAHSHLFEDDSVSGRDCGGEAGEARGSELLLADDENENARPNQEEVSNVSVSIPAASSGMGHHAMILRRIPLFS